MPIEKSELPRPTDIRWADVLTPEELRDWEVKLDVLPLGGESGKYTVSHGRAPGGPCRAEMLLSCIFWRMNQGYEDGHVSYVLRHELDLELFQHYLESVQSPLLAFMAAVSLVAGRHLADDPQRDDGDAQVAGVDVRPSRRNGRRSRRPGNRGGPRKELRLRAAHPPPRAFSPTTAGHSRASSDTSSASPRAYA